ncbi:GNAT family N-acetyltransferase [Nocardia niigatensis]
MGMQEKQTVDIGYATARHIQKAYGRWAKAVGVAGTPLGRAGSALASSWSRNELSSTLVPNFTDVLTAAIVRGPEAAICSRSIVLSARIGERVIGGLVARPQQGYIDGVAPLGRAVQAQMLVRLMKLEIVAVDPEYHHRRIGTTMIQYAVDVLETAGVHLVYGTFPAERGLGLFYRSLGFTVLEPGHAIDLTKATGASLGIVTADDERLFARRLGDGPELEIVPPGEGVLIG